MDETTEGRGLRTLTRGLQLLEVVVAADGRATAKSIAVELRLSQSTCYELLKTLELAGYIVRVMGGFYEVGPAVPAMFRRLGTTLTPGPRVSAALRALRDKTGETSYASALRGTGVLLQEVLEGRKALVVRLLEPGFRANYHARASCRAILAYLPEPERRRILTSRPLAQVTPYTITDRRRLRAEFKAVPEMGYAVERQEFQVGIGCVAAPFFDRTGRVAGALTVAMPIANLNADEQTIAGVVMGCAADAGYPQGDHDVSSD